MPDDGVAAWIELAGGITGPLVSNKERWKSELTTQKAPEDLELVFDDANPSCPSLS